MSETLARDGFRPVLITACPVDGRDLYAGLWQQGVAPETVAQHTISDKPEAEGFQRREFAEFAGIHHVNGVSARVPRQSQDQQNWCWAAAAVSIDCAYNNGTSRWKQCDIAAEYFKRYDSKNYNCCGSDGPNTCNKSAELENALRIVGHFVRFIKNPVAFETLTQELTRNRPVGVRILWAGSATGHFVVVAGCYTVGSVDWVLVMDPEHTGGMVHMPYDTLKNAYPPHRGTWTTTYFTA